MTGKRCVLWMPPTWDLDRYRIIWVSVAKLDASWQKEPPSYYLPPGAGTYIGRWLLAQSPRCRVKMPDIGWVPDVTRDARGRAIGETGQYHVAFGNGRHRTAWMRDHGATALPVVVRNVDDQAEIIAAELGTVERETWVRLPATEKRHDRFAHHCMDCRRLRLRPD
jgi:hypothetical protein